ncbi:MAG TPA: hypothetical protein PK156_27310 [Polyangium sp.]|nr:hypothetical protein [Polyangium sp.]
MESSIRRQQEEAPFVMERIRWALENRDAEALANVYAEDAVIEEISSLHPPAHPVIVRGRKALLERFKGDFSVDAVGGWHRRIDNLAIVDAVETTESIAFTEVRTYAAGDKVITQHMAHKVGGRITHDRLVIARDSE